MNHFLFDDRYDAGQKLALELLSRPLQDPIILALPRGGVPVAEPIAQAFHTGLDVVVVRKIGSPFNPEYGIGAVSEDFDPILKAEDFLDGRMEREVDSIIDEEKKEVQRRIHLYREGRSLPDVRGKSVILVDDGLATGITAATAGRFLKRLGPKEVVLAVPVGPSRVGRYLEVFLDEVICLHAPWNFTAVGNWYKRFHQVSDHEVLEILHKFHPEGIYGTQQI